MFVTLNISNTGIRLLAAEGRRITRWAEAPLAPGVVKDGLILQPPAVGGAIDALLKETKATRERVITCLTGLVFTYRFLTLPRMKPALQDEAIQRAARKEIPLPPEELYLSWQNTGVRQRELDYFVAGVARHPVDALVRTLEAASVKPCLMDLKPLALARAAGRGEAIIASLEPDYFDIVLVVKGIPAILYTVSPRWAGATPEENARQLVDELLKTVGFYNGSHPREPMGTGTPLLLTGALTSEAALAGLIQNEVAYPVQPLVPPLVFPDELPVASYAANIGLALKRMPPGKAAKGATAGYRDINVNMLSGKYRKARARPVSMKRVLGLLVLAAAIVLLFPMYQQYRQAGALVLRLQAELVRIEQENYQAELALKKAEPVEAAIRNLSESAKTLRQGDGAILAHRGEFTSDLSLVTGALPPQAYFTSIEMEKTQLTVQVKADSPFDAVTYALALEAPGRFSEVRIINIGEAPVTAGETGEDNAGITFSVSLNK